MLTVDTIAEVRQQVTTARRAGRHIALVPTMGALHEGHASLIRSARVDANAFVVVSIFVNPTQFGPNEDFDAYPRTLADDQQVCEREGADLIFAPSAGEMYPPEAASGGVAGVTTVHVSNLTERLCGAHRPGHFDGVTTVVAKLFTIVGPDVAYFGQKDAQQARVIRQMVDDLNFPVEIEICPTVRDADGLATSSRNVYLSNAERMRALRIHQALGAADSMVRSGRRDVDQIIIMMRETILGGDSGSTTEIDYIELVNPDTLLPVERVEGPVLALVAVRVGRTRLIDNMLLESSDDAR